MEQLMKKRSLLIASILGILCLIIWLIVIFSMGFFSIINGIREVGLDQIIKNLESPALEGTGTLEYLPLFIGMLIYIPVVFISLILAITLNVIGWLKNNSKKILIAAILYLVSLNIPSAVLCFIGFGKLKK